MISRRAGITIQQMYRVILIAILCLASALSARAEEPRFSIEARGGVARLYGGEDTFVPFQKSWGARFGYRIAERLTIGFDVGRFQLYNDTTSGSAFDLGSADKNATWRFRGTRLGLTLDRDLLSHAHDLRWAIGLGGGLALWEITDPAADTALKVSGSRGQTMDYSADEIILSGQTLLGLALSPHWTIGIHARADYLTGLGADFDDTVMDIRDDLIVEGMLTIRFNWGKIYYGWQSDRSWVTQPTTTERVYQRHSDGDNDGIADADDQCPNTRSGVVVDRSGCAVDSDFDGVPDGLDDCPGTPGRAKDRVDVSGCPIDTDFDGIPDYRDNCPESPVGGAVDTTGCPIDSDGDGVPDGLDDCPNTLVGVDVDVHGCIDLSMLAEPMVLNIDYISGSFEVDPKTKERLKSLARILVFVEEVKIEINGYTDNIGLATANRKLSEKRAGRVRDFLASQGVGPERMKVFGRGETNFVASNETAAGRARNRRVELIFYF